MASALLRMLDKEASNAAKPQPAPPQGDPDPLSVVIEGEQIMALWTNLQPEKRRVVLALVRAMSEG